ncbi:hypothetical protein P5673_010290, partial [Acropora cervicornis]
MIDQEHEDIPFHDDRSSNDLGLRGPPLDENLLLSNIATANKKVKHLSEVGH